MTLYIIFCNVDDNQVFLLKNSHVDSDLHVKKNSNLLIFNVQHTSVDILDKSTEHESDNLNHYSASRKPIRKKNPFDILLLVHLAYL